MTTAFKAKMKTEQARQIYSQRSQIAKFPYAWIKERCGLRQFRCRGRLEASMEATWRASATTSALVQPTTQAQRPRSRDSTGLGRAKDHTRNPIDLHEIRLLGAAAPSLSLRID